MYNTTHTLKKVLKEVDRDKRVTSEVMTPFEYTNVIATRAKQMENGSPIFVDYDPNNDNYEILAKKEIKEKMCPISIIRNLNDTYLERWDVNEMIIPKI